MKESKTVSLTAFFAMLFSLTMLCIFLYFGGCEMDCCEKLIIAIIIGVITAIVSLCVLCCCDSKTDSCAKSLYVEDAGVYILYKDKKKTKFCRVQYYDSVSDLEKSKEKTCRIFINEGVKIDKELVSFLTNNGYEFSVAESGNLIYVKGKSERDCKHTNNEDEADKSGGN